MNAFNIYSLIKMGKGDRLLDADIVIIPADTQTDDELTAEKVRQLIDTAWSVLEQRDAKKGLSRKGDATLHRLISAFNAWVETSEIETTDIWK